jgi:hypothetical protein
MERIASVFIFLGLDLGLGFEALHGLLIDLVGKGRRSLI